MKRTACSGATGRLRSAANATATSTVARSGSKRSRVRAHTKGEKEESRSRGQVGVLGMVLDHRGDAVGRHGPRPPRRHGASAPWRIVARGKREGG